MKRVYLDVATTGVGLEDRIVEIMLIEELEGELTGNQFHAYINPQSTRLTEAAIDATGHNDGYLKQFEPFEKVVSEVIRFVENAELVCWYVDYDVAFVNRELARLCKHEITIIGNCILGQDVRTIVKKYHPHSSLNRDFLYQYYDVKFHNNGLTWLQSNCLGMAYLYPRISA